MKRRIAFLLAVGLAVAACGGTRPVARPAPPRDVFVPVAVTSTDLRALSADDASFGNDLFAQLLRTEHGNVVLSATSIATALQMAYIGARGRTATELAAAMHLRALTQPQVAAATSHLLASLTPLAHDRYEQLTVANDVWVQSGLALTPAYESTMRHEFASSLHRTDFAGQPDRARRLINDSIAAETHGRIRDLIAPEQIGDSTRVVLTDAIYMKSRWASPFAKALTKDRVFHLADGSTVQAPTMAQRPDGPTDYAARNGWQAVRLPYLGGRLAMTVMLAPAGSHAMPPAFGRFRPAPVDLWLPKFTFTWSQDLSSVLQSLGVHLAFGSDADFSGIETREALYIQFVQHKARVAVDEDGTEAAAATGIVMGTAGVYIPPQPPVVMHVDRPFFFAITDTRTGLPLFQGRIANPTLGG